LVHADQFRGDVDIGGMVRLGVARIGVVVKHAYEPELTAEGVRLTAFDRQVRVGAAWMPHPRAVSVNAAFDADLTTTTPLFFGNERRLAGGGELWFDRRVG